MHFLEGNKVQKIEVYYAERREIFTCTICTV